MKRGWKRTKTTLRSWRKSPDCPKTLPPDYDVNAMDSIATIRKAEKGRKPSPSTRTADLWEKPTITSTHGGSANQRMNVVLTTFMSSGDLREIMYARDRWLGGT